MTEWHNDPAAALKYAQTFSPKSYPMTVPPHWLRCNYVTETGVRCCKGEDHEKSADTATAKHEEPKA